MLRKGSRSRSRSSGFMWRHSGTCTRFFFCMDETASAKFLAPQINEVWKAAVSFQVDEPDSPFALLKMCDYFQMHKYVDIIVEALFSMPEKWPLCAVPFLNALRPDLLDSPNFPFEKVASATMERFRSPPLAATPFSSNPESDEAAQLFQRKSCAASLRTFSLVSYKP
uniref:Uncharacterized protein n=1 Tax=Chromera velia CCMP2878 TaxID=1169474 RepID=A0A0G4FWV6_9ALVE|eukprot:Cvel_19173.t1-p1 / transcript=Cvel_19173.t1 / gene=Cvel_19173 / organism=Chromera_velia_CCMP2878 / gene_product=hypothetical protein / transcript_product=hypothetical protein / location=Cvel_scaffold1634:9761-10261(-) / protein_length=167 / sequence_SO=supercontig / SO=protein_coding / is_pseudo=false